jgi:predicted helicase
MLTVAQAQEAVETYLKAVGRSYAAGNATEHTYRPDLKRLIETLDNRLTATNEPKRVACGAPDYVVTRQSEHGPLTIGYIEAKDISKPLDEVERSEQMKRYLAALPNLILTDYLEFRWYVDGQRREPTVCVAQPGKGNRLVAEPGSTEALFGLLSSYLEHTPEPIQHPQELARRMARLTHMIRDIIIAVFEQNEASTLLKGWREAFARTLIADLDQEHKTPEFADMFAQTLAYGLFSARVMDTTPGFSRAEAQRLIPKTNPFLRKFFQQISGADMEDEPYAGFVDDLAALLAYTDMDAVLENFGKRTRQQDPVVHFYETFLAAYDPKLREARGVYYTPEPVVSYIVRSVDRLLKSHFGCADGLADRSTVTIQRKDSSGRTQNQNVPRVLILDPATGTGTFLYSVIDHIRQGFISRGNAGMWPGYVRDHLLPRLFGFELLMAPYAVAHFKLGLQLAGRDLPPELRANWTYDAHGSDDRLGIYLTNTLETVNTLNMTLPTIMQWVTDEASAANRVKTDLPIMVVMGNPPYSGHSANKGAWIDSLLKGALPGGKKVPSYFEVDGKPLDERNPKWLKNDYVKFIRFGQWRIEQTGAGVLAFITDHGYLHHATFRGMRQQLLSAFTDIYILNLHGRSKGKETAPDGLVDQNVFDIQQGVAIGIFIKQPSKDGPARLHYADLWGIRNDKYFWLLEHEIANTQWIELTPQPPFYLFEPQNTDLRGEYEQGRSIREIMAVNVLGFQSHRDEFAIDFDRDRLHQRIKEMSDRSISDGEFRQRYQVKDNRDWQLQRVRLLLYENATWEKALINCLYHPFDWRPCYFSKAAIDYPRRELLNHVAGKENLCLNTVRQTRVETWQHSLVSNCPVPAVGIEIKDGSSVFPLYLYPVTKSAGKGTTWPPGKDDRIPNLDHRFVADMEERLDLEFVTDGTGDLQSTFGPEDVFHYIYAILHSPTYRTRYAEFLKGDFPRIPLTSDVALFRALCGLGRELVAWHLMEKKTPEDKLMTRYPVPGDNEVEKGHPRYDESTQRVYINKDKPGKRGQYFEGVPKEVWQFHVGGYQVLDKWLKDRRGRHLSFEDLSHYQQIVEALSATIHLMAQIDEAIPAWPIT